MLLVGFVISTLLGQPGVRKATARLDIPVRAVRVSDDDGGRPAAVSPPQVQRWVEYADRVYAPAGIRFRYETADGMAEHRSTRLNDVTGVGDRDWSESKGAGNRLAAEHPGTLTVLFRHGPGASPSGGGFGEVDYDFVVMPGFDATTVCGEQNIGLFAHEVGHYLGLMHTFAREFPTVAEAGAWLGEHGGDVSSFDGDRLSDTPPDPFIRALQCGTANGVTLLGRRIAFDRGNVMGYWDRPRATLSRQQAEVARWFARRRLRFGMQLPANGSVRSPLEAEALEVNERRGVRTGVQPMIGFGAGNWSGDAQLFVSGEPGGSLAFALPVEKAGRYRLSAYLTMGPDFGRFQIRLDGKRLGGPIDLYAPRVIASGRIALTTRALPAGRDEVRVGIAGRNPASSGSVVGIDCFEVEPEGPPRAVRRLRCRKGYGIDVGPDAAHPEGVQPIGRPA